MFRCFTGKHNFVALSQFTLLNLSIGTTDGRTSRRYVSNFVAMCKKMKSFPRFIYEYSMKTKTTIDAYLDLNIRVGTGIQTRHPYLTL